MMSGAGRGGGGPIRLAPGRLPSVSPRMAGPTQPPTLDEERLARAFAGLDRKALGAFFTPAWLVERTLALALAHAPEGPLAVVDPACGAGAFLAAAARALPHAELFGLELHPDVARVCRARVPGAHVEVGDALRGGLAPLLARVPAGVSELWVGNPPYNGTSALLQDPTAWHHVTELLPVHTPPGTSLRDDFALFLLVAARRLSERPGVLALITPASLLDAYLYAPLREVLLGTLALRRVVDLGPGVFRDARVRTCISVWTSRVLAPRASPLYARGDGGPERPLTPRPPEWLLTPTDEAAEALDARWRAAGEPLTALVPVSLPGVKTRFDELLVDTDRARLLARLHAFARTPSSELAAFARERGIPPALVPKLRALKVGEPFTVDETHVRPFFRYRGAHHRGHVPPEARAWCYLDRRLIPRGDHRLRGGYDPHAERVKLLFNVRELPLSAALLEEEGCVHDHRHARFAPLHVPERVHDLGLEVTRSSRALGPPVPNLSPRGRAWAARLGGPHAAFRALVAFLNGPEVQGTWAPAFGTTRVVPVPVDDPAAWGGR